MPPLYPYAYKKEQWLILGSKMLTTSYKSVKSVNIFENTYSTSVIRKVLNCARSTVCSFKSTH